MHAMSESSPDGSWRDELLDATIERRLGDLDRRTLVHRLDTANRPARRDAVRGEIEVVLRFLRIGARVGTEVSAPDDHPVDLRVSLGDLDFAVHVKRLGAAPTPFGEVPRAFEALVEVPRPYVVGVDWRGGDAPVSGLEEMREFLMGARVGDRLLLRDADDGPAGTMEILAPTGDPDGRVVLKAAGDALAASAFVERAGRHLRRAYRQFAPGVENVIVLAGGGPGADDLVDLALLGGHVERWDRLPKVGQRIAHGRDDRGLWTGRRFDRSRIAAWCPLFRTEGRVWKRAEASTPPGVLETVQGAIVGG